MRFKSTKLVYLISFFISLCNCKAQIIDDELIDEEIFEEQIDNTFVAVKSFSTKQARKRRINLKSFAKVTDQIEDLVWRNTKYELVSKPYEIQAICTKGQNGFRVLSNGNKIYENSVCELPFNVLERMTKQGCLALNHDFWERNEIKIYLEPGNYYNTVAIFVAQLMAATKIKFLNQSAFIGIELCGDGSCIPSSGERFVWNECRLAKKLGIKRIFVPSEYCKSVPNDLKQFVFGINHITDLADHNIFTKNPFVTKEFQSGTTATSIIVDGGTVSLLRVTVIPEGDYTIISNALDLGPQMSLDTAIELNAEHIKNCSILVQSSTKMRGTGMGFGMRCALEAALKNYTVQPWPMSGTITFDDKLVLPADLIKKGSKVVQFLGFKQIICSIDNRNDVVTGLEIIVPDSTKPFITQENKAWDDIYSKIAKL